MMMAKYRREQAKGRSNADLIIPRYMSVLRGVTKRARFSIDVKRKTMAEKKEQEKMS